MNALSHYSRPAGENSLFGGEETRDRHELRDLFHDSDRIVGYHLDLLSVVLSDSLDTNAPHTAALCIHSDALYLLPQLRTLPATAGSARSKTGNCYAE